MLVIQEILGYFLIGLIGMLILAVFYLPIYFLLRKKVPLSRQIAYFMLVVCVVVILSATVFISVFGRLSGGVGIFAKRHFLNIIPFRFLTKAWEMSAEKKFTQEIANVIMFIPLGFVFPIAFKKGRKFWKTAICMITFSFLIEFVQYFIGRSADIDDIILNTLGGVLGYFIFYIFSRLFRNKKFWKKLNGISL